MVLTLALAIGLGPWPLALTLALFLGPGSWALDSWPLAFGLGPLPCSLALGRGHWPRPLALALGPWPEGFLRLMGVRLLWGGGGWEGGVGWSQRQPTPKTTQTPNPENHKNQKQQKQTTKTPGKQEISEPSV